jgi:hypothetical protein
MKKMYLIVISLWTMMFLSGCDVAKVDAGGECALIDQPYMFGDNGVRKGGVVDYDYLTPGRHYLWATTNTDCWDIRPRIKNERFEDITTADNMNVDLETTLTVIIKKGGSSIMTSDWGDDWYRNNIQKPYRELVRAGVNEYDSQQLRTDPKKRKELGEDIQKKIAAYVSTLKSQNGNPLPVLTPEVVLDKAVPPDEVLAEAAQTAAQAQKQKTQSNREKAATARKSAEEAEAAADNAYRNKLGYTTDQYLEYLKIKNTTLKYELIGKGVEKGKVDFVVTDIEPLKTL